MKRIRIYDTLAYVKVLMQTLNKQAYNCLDI